MKSFQMILLLLFRVRATTSVKHLISGVIIWSSTSIIRILNKKLFIHEIYIVTDFINALPGNSHVNTVPHATIEEAVFSVDPTDAPIDWVDSDHVICVYCRPMSVPRV
jgi:hypothetical protein